MSERRSPSFADYLRALPPDLVLGRLLPGAGSRRKILSSSVIAEIAADFSRPALLQKRFDSLSVDSRRRCSLAYLLGDSGLPAADTKGFNDELLASFLVCAVRDGQGAIRLRGFDEFVSALRKKAGAVLAGAAKAAKPVRVPLSSPWHCINDTTVIMVLAGQGLIKTTKTGALAKVSHLLCRKVLHGGRSVLRQNLDALVLSVLRFGIERELLLESAGEYSVQFDHLLHWLDAGREKARADLTRYFMHERPDWRWESAQEFLAAPERVWFTASVFPAPCLDQALLALTGAEFLGLVDVVKEGDETLFSWAIHHTAGAADASGRVVIMPDFSAVLPQETAGPALCWFMRMGALSSLDQVYHGAIDKETVCNNLSAGVNGDDLVARLTAWEAPHNVVATVREWVREFNRVAMTDGSVIVCADSAVAEQIAAYQPLSQLLTPMPAHAVFRIRHGREREVGERLRAIGFDTRMPFQSGRAPAQEPLVTAPPAEMELVTSFDEPPKVEREVRGSKYGSELKVLDGSNLLQVIEYAILMGQQLQLDYGGSAGIRGGLHTVVPLRHLRGPQAAVEAEDSRTGTVKKFFLEKIKRIGVVTP